MRKKRKKRSVSSQGGNINRFFVAQKLIAQRITFRPITLDPIHRLCNMYLGLFNIKAAGQYKEYCYEAGAIESSAGTPRLYC